jgi:predicted DNA-binding transcriptional regulator YafY
MLLTRLYSGEKLHLHELAAEYNVTLRTLQRDFNERLSYLPIESRNRQYWLNSEFFTRNRNDDLLHLAKQLGLTDIFPHADEQQLRRLLNKRQPALISFKGISTSSTKAISLYMPMLELALTKHLICQVVTHDGLKRRLKPYQLVNYRGDWNMIGVCSEQLTCYLFDDIQHIELTDCSFVPDNQVYQMIENDKALWEKIAGRNQNTAQITLDAPSDNRLIAIAILGWCNKAIGEAT